MKRYILLTLGCMMLLTACMTETPTATVGPDPTAIPEVNMLPTPQPPDSPISVPPTPQLSNALPRELYGDLRNKVAQKLGVAPETLTMVQSEEVQWRNSSLGCPQKGMNYLQVITPGWRIIFEDQDGRWHYVHTSERTQNFIICKDSKTLEPGSTPIPNERDMNIVKDTAITLLMEQLQVERQAISIVSVESVEWRNSCLGCQLPKQNCLMVITPGFRVTLESGGKTYYIHSNHTGEQAIICEKPLAPKADS